MNITNHAATTSMMPSREQSEARHQPDVIGSIKRDDVDPHRRPDWPACETLQMSRPDSRSGSAPQVCGVLVSGDPQRGKYLVIGPMLNPGNDTATAPGDAHCHSRTGAEERRRRRPPVVPGQPRFHLIH